jgi:cation:H+ antiporter
LNQQISTGAILGAPLMLATLSTFLVACAALPQRGWRGRARPERSGLMRDLDFFALAFALAALAMFVPQQLRSVRAGLAMVLMLIYFGYLLLTLRASQSLVLQGHATSAQGRPWLSRLGLPTNRSTLLAQLGAAVVLLLLATKGLIGAVQAVSGALGVSALLLALLIVPIATELPEKVNSILWIRRGKDTLALGNVTGALVFQGTLLPALGILFTPWQPRPEALAGVLLTLLGAGWLRVWGRSGQLPLVALLFNGVLYVFFLASALAWH